MDRAVKQSGAYILNLDDLFFGAYVFLYLSYSSNYTNLSSLFGSSFMSLLTRTSYILFLVCCMGLFLLRGNYRRRDIFIIAIFLGIALLSYYMSTIHYFFDLILMMLCARNIDFEKFLRRAFWFQLIFTLILVAGASIGVVRSSYSVRSNGATRSSLGFNHPNTLGLMSFQLVAMFLLINKDRKGWGKYIFSLLVGIVVYRVCDSQTSIVCFLLLIGGFIAYDLLKGQGITQRRIRGIVAFVVIISFVILVLIIWYYWNHVSELPFATMASRIRYAKQYLRVYGVKLFGNKVKIGEGVQLQGYYRTSSWLDNAQARLLIQYGIMGSIIFWYSYIRAIITSLRKDEIYLVIIASVYVVYSISEFKSILPSYNFFIIYAGIVLFNRVKERNIIKSRVGYFETRHKLSGMVT